MKKRGRVQTVLIILKRFFDWNYIKDFSKHYFGGMYTRTEHNHLFLFAAGLAFSIFVCMIPFVLMMSWLLGNFLDYESLQFQLTTLVNALIPYDTYADFVLNIIFARIDELIRYKNVAGLVGLFALLFTASSLISSIRTILNKVFGATTDVNVFLGKLWDFAWILLLILLFLSSMLLLPLIDVFRSASEYIPLFRFLQYGIFQKFFTLVLSLVIVFFLFFMLYKFAAVVRIRKRSALVGALWAALLWVAAKQIFGYYIYNFGSLGKIYGAYVLIIVVGFWIYYSAIVFILGAEVAKLYNERIDTKEPAA